MQVRVLKVFPIWVYVWPIHCNTLQHTATHCNTLQHTLTHQVLGIWEYGNALQHTATHCNTLQHTAAHGTAPKQFTPSCVICVYVLPCLIDPRVRKIRNETPAGSCPGIFCRTFHVYCNAPPTATHMSSLECGLELARTVFSFFLYFFDVEYHGPLITVLAYKRMASTRLST